MWHRGIVRTRGIEAWQNMPVLRGGGGQFSTHPEILTRYTLRDAKENHLSRKNNVLITTIMEEAMQPIDTSFADRRYTYTQLERQGDIAIYEQRHKENPTVVRYEVVRIRVRPAGVLPDGRPVPERESYPSSSEWGRYGFTCMDVPEARALAATLRQSEAVA
jgi:hypothetical protein